MQTDPQGPFCETVTLVKKFVASPLAGFPHDGHWPLAIGITSVKQLAHSTFTARVKQNVGFAASA
jgi:hypothetical protein